MLGVGGDVGYGGCEPRVEGIVQGTKRYCTILRKWHLQNFISIFSKGRNFTRGDNSKKKKYVSAIFP